MYNQGSPACVARLSQRMSLATEPSPSLKRALQWTIAILSLLPLTFGTLGLLMGVAMYIPPEAATPKLDSQFRFMSAWDIGLAFVSWWFIAHIEEHAVLFKLVCLAVFLGGVGRMAAWLFTGSPGIAFAAVAVVELLVPLLIPWQSFVARTRSTQSTVSASDP
jgi:Domain of unknown function (DUF4345)